MKLRVVGVDVAFANFGLVKADISGWPNGYGVGVRDLTLLSTEGRDRKTVRKSSDDLRRAKELVVPFVKYCEGATIAFAEVPHGSQSARASWSLGVAVGVLASCPIPIIQVSALEVKMNTVGKKNASKQEMIDWAVERWPNANWIRHRGKLTNANEHLADAIATIHAGLHTDEFKLMATQLSSLPTTRRRVILK